MKHKITQQNPAMELNQHTGRKGGKLTNYLYTESRRHLGLRNSSPLQHSSQPTSGPLGSGSFKLPFCVISSMCMTACRGKYMSVDNNNSTLTERYIGKTFLIRTHVRGESGAVAYM